jgi:hypothetical protein
MSTIADAAISARPTFVIIRFFLLQAMAISSYEPWPIGVEAKLHFFKEKVIFEPSHSLSTFGDLQ